MSSADQPLVRRGIVAAYHYVPLHYLPFIARRRALLSKTRLLTEGYSEHHFRSTSRRQDSLRGFASYVHLTLDSHPPILKAKLAGGFPHFEVSIPVEQIEQHPHLLCRFNIAKTRYFRGALQEPPESDENGRYYRDLRLPVAVTPDERTTLLRLNYGRRMIEVLVLDEMPLGATPALRFFHPDDLTLAERVIKEIGVAGFQLALDGQLSYERNADHVVSVTRSIETALKDPVWHGNGLEFDRV